MYLSSNSPVVVRGLVELHTLRQPNLPTAVPPVAADVVVVQLLVMPMVPGMVGVVEVVSHQRGAYEVV